MDGSEQLEGRWREGSQGPPQETLSRDNVWASVLRLPIAAFSVSFSIPCWSLLTPGGVSVQLPPACSLHLAQQCHLTGQISSIWLALGMPVLTTDKKPLLTQLPEALQALGIDLLTVWVWAQCRGGHAEMQTERRSKVVCRVNRLALYGEQGASKSWM